MNYMGLQRKSSNLKFTESYTQNDYQFPQTNPAGHFHFMISTWQYVSVSKLQQERTGPDSNPIDKEVTVNR